MKLRGLRPVDRPPPAAARLRAERGIPMPYQTTDERLAEELSRYGLRATRQRISALRLLRRVRSQPRAAEVHRRLLPDHPNLSQKTVYEILDALVEAGLASRVAQGGEAARYEARADPHYHSRCRICGRLDDLSLIHI